MKGRFTNFSRMLSLLAMVFLFKTSSALVSNGYVFSVVSGTYTPLAGGTNVTGTGPTWDDNSTTALPIGFTFNYNGTNYTTFSANANGFIAMGSAIASSYTALSTGTTNNVIAAANADLYGNTANGASYTYRTTGSAPSRVMTIEWKNWGRFSSGYNEISMQIKLYETTNVIEIVYNPGTAWIGTSTRQVGLRGAAATDFNNISLTSSSGGALPWTSPTGGTANTANVGILTSTNIPTAGLIYRWRPVASGTCLVPRITSLVFASPNITVNWGAVAGATGYNLRYRTSPSGSWTVIPLGAVTTYTMAAICGDMEFQISNSCGTEYSNSMIYSTGTAAPTWGSISNTGTTFTLNWSNTGAGQYTVQYRVIGAASFSPLPGGPFLTNSATVTLPVTAYEFQVRSECSGGSPAGAYNASTYYTPLRCEVTRSTGITFNSIQSTGTPFSWTGTLADDNTTNVVALPFAFTYAGFSVSQFRVCTNGWMSLNGASTATTYSNSFASGTTATLNTVLAPFWDDLVCQGYPGTSANLSLIKYQVDGAAPNRVLTVEWFGMERYNIPSPDLNFQVKLYETSNRIEFIYGTMVGQTGAAVVSYSYSQGLTSPVYGGISGTSNLWCTQAGAENTKQFGNIAADNLQFVPECNSMLAFDPASSYTAGSAYPAPSNDNFASAILIPTGFAPCSDYCGQNFRSTGATASGSPAACAGTPDDDVWFKFVAVGDSSNVRIINTDGYQAVVQIVDSTGAALVPASCVTGTTGTITTASYIRTAGGSTYYVRVYHSGAGSSAATNSGSFNICIYGNPQPPANDNCTGAITLPFGLSCSPTSGITSTATASAEAVCGGTADDDVWYKFTTGATTNKAVVTVSSASGFNAHVQIFSGSCGSLTSLYCLNATGLGAPESQLFTVAPLTTYYVRVYHSAAGYGSGAFNICAYDPSPVNDKCTGAISVTCAGSPYTGVTSFADYDSNLVDAGAGTGVPKGIWYVYAGNNQRVTLNTCSGTTFNTRISVYTGACGSLTPVTGNDDYCGTGSQVSFNAILGNNYYILVHGNGTASGNFTLGVSCAAMCTEPANDNCSTATPILTLNPYGSCSTTYVGTTNCATQGGPGYPAFGGYSATGNDLDVWYSFVPTKPSVVVKVDSLTATRVGVILYDSCGGAGLLAARNMIFNFEYILTPLTIGRTYYLRMTTLPTGAGTFRLCVSNPPLPPTNDTCSRATTLPVRDTCIYTAGTVAGATTSGLAMTPCTGTSPNDVWYTFRPARAGAIVDVQSTFGGIDFDARVWRGTCGALSHNKCITTFPFQLDTLAPGQLYYLQVYTPSGIPGTAASGFNVCITNPPAGPVNDNICNPTSLTYATNWANWMSGIWDDRINPNIDTIFGTNVNALRESGESLGSCGGAGIQKTVWYQFDAPSCSIKNLKVSLNHNATNFDTRMVIWRRTSPLDCNSSRIEVACNDDGGLAPSTLASIINLTPGVLSGSGTTPPNQYAPGERLFVQIFAYSSSTQGNFGLIMDADAATIKSIDSVTTTSMRVNWSSPYMNLGSGYLGTEIRWRRSTQTTGYSMVYRTGNTDSSYTIRGMLPGVSYDVWLVYVCQTDRWFSPRVVQSTNPNCPLTGPFAAPIVTGVAGHCAQANISWSPVPGAQGYNIYFRRSGYPGYSTINVGLATSYLLNYMTLNQSYDIWIEARCTTPGPLNLLSSAVTTYVTCASPARLANPEDLIGSFKYGDMNFVNMNIVDVAEYISMTNPSATEVNLQALKLEGNDIAGLAEGEMNVYPNPTTDATIVSYVLPSSAEKLTLRVMNMQGQEVSRKEIAQPEESGSIDLNTSAFGAGVYFIHLETSNFNITKKLVVDR